MTTKTYEELYKEASIELDCPPGGIRPNDLIGGVLEGTGFTAEDFTTGAPFFGHQTWVLIDPDRVEEFKSHKPTFKARIVALYNQGRIRYGTW